LNNKGKLKKRKDKNKNWKGPRKKNKMMRVSIGIKKIMQQFSSLLRSLIWPKMMSRWTRHVSPLLMRNLLKIQRRKRSWKQGMKTLIKTPKTCRGYHMVK
jgi:hypothetical protein